MNRNEAWEELFSHYHISESVERLGYFDITAQQINAVGGPDARIMAKIDSRENLPRAMSRDGLAMLATRNGEYRIARFNPFFQIPQQSAGEVRTVVFPDNIITLDPTCITTESAALDVAAVTGMLDETFGEKVQLTIRGRTTAGADFHFSIGNVPFSVSGVQVEVDGGYEGEHGVNLVEAKLGGKSNLNARQILYPHRCWEKLVSGSKQVRSYVFLYQEPLFRFIPIDCTSGSDVTANIAGERVFRVEEATHFDFRGILLEGRTPLVDLDVPFPQADDFDKVLTMLSVVYASGGAAKSELSLEFDITERQIDYYFAALRWMRLSTEQYGKIILTPRGTEISQMGHRKKIRALAEIIFSEPIFHQAFAGTTPDPSSPIWSRWHLNDTTRERRIRTVLKWTTYFRNMQTPFGNTMRS